MTVNELVDKLVDIEHSLDVGGTNPPLLTRVKIQDIITDRYLEPSPRALTRHFNNRRN